MPFTNPAFPPGPYRFVDREYLARLRTRNESRETRAERIVIMHTTVWRRRALLAANDLRACQDAARRMRRAGVPMPDGLIALAALREDLLLHGAPAPR